MSRIIIPSLLGLLDLLIEAFHLDEDGEGRRNDLHGKGPFQTFLNGRSLDLTDHTLSRLLELFSNSMLESGVFPAVQSTLRNDLPADAAPLAYGYIGDVRPMPRLTGDQAADMANRLAWLMSQTDVMLGQCRAQEAAARCHPRYLLLPLARFVGHHMTIVLALMHWCRYIDLETWDRDACLSWAIEIPRTTPLRCACEAAGITQASLQARFRRATGGGTIDDKTIANLWHGGADHPRLETLRSVLAVLYPADERSRATALPQWRRWYGLRHIAWRIAASWSWDDVSGLVGEVLHNSTMFGVPMGKSALNQMEREGVTSIGVWAGWRLGISRYAFGSALGRFHDQLSFITRHDFRALANGVEHLRLQQCFQIASNGAGLEAELQRQGKDAVTARKEALKRIQIMQCDLPELEGAGSLYDFHQAMARSDLARAEAVAQVLADQRPSVLGNHFTLISVLQVRRRFGEAFAALQVAAGLHGDAPDLRKLHAEVLMARGDETGSIADFFTAREMLAAHDLSGSWAAQLDLADCHFALGDWAAAQAACDRCIELHDECGEAFALDSICSLRLGDHKRSNKSAEYATRRGAAPFLGWLHEHDLRGSLGSRKILPPPRWHRMRYG